jgi:metallo-beta-lactamase family protein
VSSDESFPWLPVGPTDAYDPLEHHEISPSKQTPFVIVPRGGTRGIGRSCYEVQTRHSTFLVDCGLNQGSGGQFPDFRGLGTEQVDAVFLTHAHIDHCGGLPVLEAEGLLDDDAPIFATQPTMQLAHTLLEDSLKLHKRAAQTNHNTPQRFTAVDVKAIYDRFEPVEYGSRRVEEFEHISTEEHATFRFGDAAHLIGSAWLALQSDGYRVVFSGDLGGRVNHLHEIEQPPEADTLLLESTYGATHSHQSMKDARRDLYQSIADDVRNRRPVLIPTFAVGRAQTILHKLSERFRVDEDIREASKVVLDGMAQEATDIYHTHVTDEVFYSASITNPAENSGMTTPFSPATTTRPETDADRERVLSEFEEGGAVPIIIVPSGMLTGGHSPRYLAELRARFDEASVYLTGYQANGTPGSALQNAASAGGEKVSLTISTDAFGHDWPRSDAVSWTTAAEGDERVRLTVSTDWVTTVKGLSGHASQQFLLKFARDVSPETVGLIHGPAYAQTAFLAHLAENLETGENITRTRMLTPIPVTRDPEILTASKSYSESSKKQDMKTQLHSVSDEVSMLSDEVASVRNEALTEDDVRRIVKDELEKQKYE